MNAHSVSKIPALIVVLALASGCATITTSEMQAVQISTITADGMPVMEADCSVQNDQGSWQITTPTVAHVRRSSKDLLVNCKKEGFPDGSMRAISRATGGMWGNIILFAGIGAIIDHNTGTGYDYPNELPVKLGANTIIDKRDDKSDPPKDAKNENGQDKNDSEEKKFTSDQ